MGEIFCVHFSRIGKGKTIWFLMWRLLKVLLFCYMGKLTVISSSEPSSLFACILPLWAELMALAMERPMP